MNTNQQVDTRRVLIFLSFAFGIAWLTALVIFLNGQLVNSRQLAPGLSLAAILLPTAYMWAPALANIITRLITRQGFADSGLRPFFGLGWPYWAAAWVLPAVLTILGMAIYFLIFPQYYAGLQGVEAQMKAAGQTIPGNLWPFVVGQVLIAILISPIVNGLFSLGEEFGWRAYLLPELLPLGTRRAVILHGLIWGVWHWPIIAMGYEYGFDYPGFPWVGLLLFLLFTVSTGIFLAWVTFRGRSVWPAVIGHSAINGIAALAVLFTQGSPLTLLGPLPVGLIGMVGFLVLGAVLYFLPKTLVPQVPSDLPYATVAGEG